MQTFKPLSSISTRTIKMLEENKNSDFITSLCKSIKSSRDYSEAMDNIVQCKQQCDDVQYFAKNNLYTNGNYYILPGFLGDTENMAKNLQFINRCGYCRTSAPYLIDIPKTKDDKFGAIIYRINDTTGGVLTPLNGRSDISADKIKQFTSEQLQLLKETSLYNTKILESKESLYLTPDSKNIFVDAWGDVQKCSSLTQKLDIANKIKHLL